MNQPPGRVSTYSSEKRSDSAAIAATGSGVRFIPAVCIALMAVVWAFRQGGPEQLERFWDDALFFRRVAYNIVHHGVAAWNVADGPVFINTSQLFQLIGVGLFAAFPGYYNASAILWSAVCIAACWWLLWRATAPDLVHGIVALALLSAPPIFFSIGTGMETATVLLIVCASSIASLRDLPLWAAASLQLGVYLARPDAALLSLIIGPGLLIARGKRRDALALALSTLLGIGILCLVFHAYYGTPLPLAAYLKITPLSVYDQHYLGLGSGDKLANLTLTAVTVSVMAPLIACRLDRTNLVLVFASVTFIAYHALTTNEIMGYHARFYAPALPVLALAALRGLDAVRSTRQKWLVAAFGGVAVGLVALAFERLWIETTVGKASIWHQYITFALGPPLAGLLLLLARRPQQIAAAAFTLGLTAFQVRAMAPPRVELESDAASDFGVYSTNRGQVGIEVIKACFPEPVQLMHSELGIPGVLLPESRVLDYTGLANPDVVHRTFDFERVCSLDKPEFIFRPNPTHQRLNRELDSSECLARYYTRAPLKRRSSCPLYVRKDLIAQYKSCRM